MVGPQSRTGIPPCEKNLWLVLEAGWFLLPFRGAGFGEESESIHASLGTPEAGCPLQSITRRKEASLVFQSEVSPAINTQSLALWRNSILLEQNSSVDLLPAVK